MKNSSIFSTIIFIFFFISADAQFDSVKNKLFNLKGDPKLSKKEQVELDSLYNAILKYEKFNREEKKFNGKVKLGITGNQSRLKDNFNASIGVEIDQGYYPVEFDFKSNIQFIRTNENFDDRIFDLDLSIDYNPNIGKTEYEKGGLNPEIFGFLSGFNNTIIGINGRLEFGGGLIFNFYSTKLNGVGQKRKASLEKLPEYKNEDGNYWKCYNEACEKIGKNLSLSDKEILDIERVRYNYRRGNIKRYSTLRLALLVGVYGEIESAILENQQVFNGQDTTFMLDDFDATTKLRFELRPTVVFKPSENFTLTLYPYFKLPLSTLYDEVIFDDSTKDRRFDSFYDFQLSLKTKISQNPGLTLGVNYRYFYDNAPKRKYLTNNLGEPVLIVGQKYNSVFAINFEYKF